jgi:hypothetical protein
MIEIDSGYLRGVGIVCPTHKLEIKERKMTSKETIQQTKEDIAVLQEKLKKLEELEIYKSKTPVQKAFYRVYGYYPSLDTDGYDGSPWQRFITGYDAGYDDGMENNKNFEKSKEIVDKHFEPTPQTPEQVEQGLRDAMKQAKEDGVFDEPKPKTLYDLIGNWWDNVFVVHNACNNETAIDYLVNDIEKWLPDEFDPNEAYEIGWNDALRTIKQKLR